MSILSDLRRWMVQENLDCFLASSTDEYLNEYIPLEQNERYFITGFTGSAGDVLVGLDNAFLFVDGRYHKQADDEVDKSLINVYKLKLGESQREAMTNILKSKGKIRVGIIPSKISYYSFCQLKKELPNLEFVKFEDEIILKLANIKSKKAHTKTEQIKLSIAGKTADEKFLQIQNNLKADLFIITKLDEIAYLTNTRSYEIPFCSSFKAKAIIDKSLCTIFTDEKIKDIGENFIIKPENEFYQYLKNIKNKKILISTTAINLKTYRAIQKNKLEEVQNSPIAEMKALKNNSEIKHLKKCFKRTDKVIAKTQRWLNRRSGKTEKDLSKKVEKYYNRQWAKGLSFKTIAASGANTAIVHYSHPSDKIIKNEMVLLDCGGYFKGGYATDITQTFFVGKNPTTEHKKVYTAVLKGFLAGVNFKLTKSSKGQNIDKMVRKIVNKNTPNGYAFSHSTGHGVGINVHENPPFITSSDWGKDVLKSGMCFSIEPGLYKDNSFGVRIERVVYIDENREIKPLSKAPFDEKLIDYNMLTKEEIKQIKEWQND